jgi:hypothetical protein
MDSKTNTLRIPMFPKTNEANVIDHFAPTFLIYSVELECMIRSQMNVHL